jgi:putative membrane protein
MEAGDPTPERHMALLRDTGIISYQADEMNQNKTDNSADAVTNRSPESDHTLTQWQRKVLYHHRKRSRLSSERNYLSWLRVSLGLITLGFVVERLELFLARFQGTSAQKLPELFLCAPYVIYFMGIVTICVATWEFFADRREIMMEERRERRLMLVLIVLILMFIVFIALLLWLPGVLGESRAAVNAV